MDAERSPLADRCKCEESPPVLPWLVTGDVNDSLRGEYRCPLCDRAWSCWWNRRSAGW